MSNHSAPSAPRIPFVYRWAWLVGVGIVLFDLISAVNSPYTYQDDATGPVVLLALGFVAISVIGSMAHLHQHDPATYRLVRDITNDLALAYVAYHAVTRSYERHTERAVGRALDSHHHEGGDYVDLDRL